jgi:putative membrane protein
VSAAVLALLCAAGGWLLARIPGVRRALTPKADRIQAVHRAAEAAFHHLGLQRARGDAGVLLYVSLEERWAVVLAGGGISDLAGPEHWERTCRLLTLAAAKGDLAGGFEQAIAETSQVLAQHHPAAADGPAAVLAQRLRILHEPF